MTMFPQMTDGIILATAARWRACWTKNLAELLNEISSLDYRTKHMFTWNLYLSFCIILITRLIISCIIAKMCGAMSTVEIYCIQWLRIAVCWWNEIQKCGHESVCTCVRTRYSWLRSRLRTRAPSNLYFTGSIRVRGEIQTKNLLIVILIMHFYEVQFVRLVFWTILLHRAIYSFVWSIFLR